jgi:peptide/nickel transport system permease protein
MSRLVLELANKVFRRGPGRWLVLGGVVIVVVMVLAALLAPLITPYDPTLSSEETLEPPSVKHPMGTNNLGYDMFSRMLYGARTVLIIVLSSTVLSMVIGIPAGLISGYAGGKIDRVLSMIMDAIYAFPTLILAIAVAAAIGTGIENTAMVIAFVYIPTYFKMGRGQTLAIKEQLFIEAIRAVGAKTGTILLRYVLPNILPTVVVVFSLSVPDAILTEAALSFFGLGVTAPTPDWGFDLRKGQAFLSAGYWWLVTFPGVMIVILAIGFSILGEGLSERYGARQVER